MPESSDRFADYERSSVNHGQIDRGFLAGGGSAGCEWCVDACGCDPDRLRNMPLLQQLCQEIIEHRHLHVVGEPLWHPFPDPGGVTGLYLLAESHLACHTYPEFQLATFNLYACRPIPAWPWSDFLAKHLGADQVQVQVCPRGLPDAARRGPAAAHPTLEIRPCS